MRPATLAASLAAAALTATAVAVPAIASSNNGPTSTMVSQYSGATTPTPLSEAQHKDVDEYLAAHPRVAQGLAEQAERWKAFTTANPELAAELQKLRALPADQRRAALEAYLKANPDQRAALKQWRDQSRQLRHDRRDQRHDRRDMARPGPTTPVPSLSGSPSGSAT